MKKILFILVCAMAILATNSASAALDSRSKIGGRDTLTNAATDTTRVTFTGAKSDMTIYVPVRKTSGTIVGTVRYYYSIDGGLTYYLAETDNLTDASNVYTYEKNYHPGHMWMVIIQTTGTSVISSEVWLQYRW